MTIGTEVKGPKWTLKWRRFSRRDAQEALAKCKFDRPLNKVAKQVGIPKSVKAEERVRQVADTSPPPNRRKNGTAAKLAKVAGVSQRTMERAMARTLAGGNDKPIIPKRRGKNTNWSVPRETKAMAAFLIQHMTTKELATLVALLEKR